MDRTNQITRKQETIDKERRDLLTNSTQLTDYIPSSLHIRTSWGQAQFLQIFINFSPFYGLLTIWFSWRIVQQSDHFQDMITVSHGFLYYILSSVWLLSFYLGGSKLMNFWAKNQHKKGHIVIAGPKKIDHNFWKLKLKRVVSNLKIL